MGYNSPRYIHTVYQAMNLAFADRDFYYGDPDFPPEEPVAGLLSKDYAKQRFAGDAPRRATTPTCGPATPTRSRAATNPFQALLDAWRTVPGDAHGAARARPRRRTR